MGNRGGQLHRTNKTLSARRWVTKSWICCRLHFNDRHRDIMASRQYTELFFLDEATALAAGHRPCAECRRPHFNIFIHHWARMMGQSRRLYVSEIDTVLHKERVDRRRRKVTFQATMDDLPNGCFVNYKGTPWLVLNNHMAGWSPGGYLRQLRLDAGQAVEVLTPRSLVGLLHAGYPVEIHKSAHQLQRPSVSNG